MRGRLCRYVAMDRLQPKLSFADVNEKGKKESPPAISAMKTYKAVELLPNNNHPSITIVYSRRFVIALGLLALCWFVHYHQSTTKDDRPYYASRNPAYLVRAQSGAVASENEICSKMGVGVLKEGGNAVDAAIVTTLCIGVANMFSYVLYQLILFCFRIGISALSKASSGIGGGGFMTVRIPPSSQNLSSEVWTVDFRETAPALANTTMYKHDPTLSMFGGLAVGVPSELRGLEEAHRRWGKLPWSRLVQPSVELASG
jgi:gamma-glutamyltranspeptidase / glutathione hydrolase / leukotriene-C4 hydrolase